MTSRAAALVGVLALAAAEGAQQHLPEPARFIDGSIPRMPPLATAGGDVVLSVAVSASGVVGAVDVLRSTPPYTDSVVQAVRTWKFEPALDANRKPMDARVLVHAVVGPPGMMVPTVGTPPKDVSTADARIPFPAQTSMPVYPVNARTEGTVLLEAKIGTSGRVAAVSAVRSAPPFDSVALAAAREWTFRPATGAGLPPSPNAYLLFAFRQPVMGPAVAPRR